MKYINSVYTPLFGMLLISCNAFSDIGDGPRAYLPPPVDTNIMTLYGMKVSGNSVLDSGLIQPNLNLDMDLMVGQFTHTMEILEHYTSFSVIQPFGKLTSNVKLTHLPQIEMDSTSKGLGDTQLLFSLGLYQLPPLTRDTYKFYKPEFAVGGYTRLTLPTGKYNQGQSANLGSNRYTLQFGAPITFGFGESFLDPRLTTIDLLPSVSFFSENTEPYKATSTKQDMLFKLEGHVTHNFNSALWGSIDGIFMYGGETTKDGEKQNNKQKSSNLGLTIGLQFSKQLALKFSYGKTISRNDSGLDGDFSRLALTYAHL